MIASDVRTVQIALAGNPNTGKTTLFNGLCKTHQRTGNFPGVTVEKKTGSFQSGSFHFAVTDLPGLYSLRPTSPDETIAANILTGRQLGINRPELILFVMDATNIERNLHLLLQLTEFSIPVAVALTMIDRLDQEGISLNIDALQTSLGLPLFEVNARSAESLDKLKSGLATLIEKQVNSKSNQTDSSDSIYNHYLPRELNTILNETTAELKNNQNENSNLSKLSRFELLNLIFFQHETTTWLRSIGIDVNHDIIQRAMAKAKSAGFTNPSVLTQARFKAASKIKESCETRSKLQKVSRTDTIDKILTHKVFGLAIFVGIMGLVFQSIYTGAAPIMDFIEYSFASLGDLVGSINGLSPLAKSFLVDGIIAGVGSVIVFVPQIAILFALIAFLEDSGYLARASFLMDRLLGWSGLNGRSFIPLLSSFACAIPGIMSARVIADRRARTATILVAPLMSCSARLPVYILFIGAFIEPVYGTMAAVATLFAMHLLGVAIALPGAFLMNRGLLKTAPSPFIMEMPAYKMPVLRNILFRVKDAVWNFTKRAGTVIFAFSIIIWATLYFPRNERSANEYVLPLTTQLRLIDQAIETANADDAAKFAADKEMISQEIENRKASYFLEHSYLGLFGRGIQPIFAPLGFDWKLSVGIVSAFPAREVILATLGIINNVGADADEESVGLRESLINATNEQGESIYNPLVAVTLMVFFALCAQCMSTLAIIQKELGHWKYPVGVFVYMTILAYVLAFVVHQLGLWLGIGGG